MLNIEFQFSSTTEFPRVPNVIDVMLFYAIRIFNYGIVEICSYIYVSVLCKRCHSLSYYVIGIQTQVAL